MLFLFLMPFQAAAVIFDFSRKKIPNTVIVGGMLTAAAYQWSDKGPPGLLCLAAGTLLPFALLVPLHYFRMLGAGDIKLLMMTGGFFGPMGSLRCVALSFAAAAGMALPSLLHRGLLRERLRYFRDYIRARLRREAWTPYITRKESRESLHFSVAILLGSLIAGGGSV